MSIESNADKRRLYNAGFTQKEIEDIDNAVDPSGNLQPPIDLNNPAWIRAMTNRRNMVQRLRTEFKQKHHIDLTRDLYTRLINLWYQRGIKRNPFDWLAQVYSKRLKPKADYINARKRRIQRSQQDLRRGFGLTSNRPAHS